MVISEALNKRAYSRLEKVFRVRYSIRNPFNQVLNSGSTTSSDVSLGGLKLFISEKIPPGTDLEIELDIGGGHYLTLKSRVVWLIRVRHGYFCGVAFAELEESVIRAILKSFFR